MTLELRVVSSSTTLGIKLTSLKTTTTTNIYFFLTAADNMDATPVLFLSLDMMSLFSAINKSAIFKNRPKNYGKREASSPWELRKAVGSPWVLRKAEIAPSL